MKKTVFLLQVLILLLVCSSTAFSNKWLADEPIDRQSTNINVDLQGSGKIMAFHDCIPDIYDEHWQNGILSGNILYPDQTDYNTWGNDWVEYNLDKKYKELQGAFFNPKAGFTNREGSYHIKIIGDGKILYQNSAWNGNSHSSTFDINVTGVKLLKISFEWGKGKFWSPIGIGNAILL
jgi:hypothetical protein